jgi:hypothetical protein
LCTDEDNVTARGEELQDVDILQISKRGWYEAKNEKTGEVQGVLGFYDDSSSDDEERPAKRRRA